MNPAVQIRAIEADLNHFNPQVRAAALATLAAGVRSGEIPVAQEAFAANMHCHTFFSFNAYGCSPSSLAWLAKKNGYRLMGIVDFDVLDGVDEFLDACDWLGVRGSAGMETRVFIPEFSNREINSPGEPGVYYFMGIGFTSSQAPPEVMPLLADLRRRAATRNRQVVERVNAALAPVCVDYERDVLPLTPSGNPTERHLIRAYLQAAERTVTDPRAYWSGKLEIPSAQMDLLLKDSPRFQNLMRSKLMKRGGAGYIEPTPATFPSVQDVSRLSAACGALPCAAWLDGTSQGEQDMVELLELLVQEGVAALNIIPDRNWNISDPDVKRVKVAKLYEIVRIAEQFDLPLNVGTEMNSFGQKHIDDFDAPDLAPVRQAFLDGAHFIYGHTALQRSLGLGYGSRWAEGHFPGRRERNHFYTQAGARIPPGREGTARLNRLGSSPDPETILEAFEW